MTTRALLWVLSLACMKANAAPTLKEWVAANSEASEKVLCQRESKGEYFFVARAEDSDRLRLGSRVDLSAYPPPAFSFSVAWMLRNQDDRSVTAKITPTVIRHDYLRADVAIEKCPVHPCAEGSLRALRYTVPVCETPL